MSTEKNDVDDATSNRSNIASIIGALSSIESSASSAGDAAPGAEPATTVSAVAQKLPSEGAANGSVTPNPDKFVFGSSSKSIMSTEDGDGSVTPIPVKTEFGSSPSSLTLTGAGNGSITPSPFKFGFGSSPKSVMSTGSGNVSIMPIPVRLPFGSATKSVSSAGAGNGSGTSSTVKFGFGSSKKSEASTDSGNVSVTPSPVKFALGSSNKSEPTNGGGDGSVTSSPVKFVFGSAPKSVVPTGSGDETVTPSPVKIEFGSAPKSISSAGAGDGSVTSSPVKFVFGSAPKSVPSTGSGDETVTPNPVKSVFGSSNKSEPTNGGGDGSVTSSPVKFVFGSAPKSVPSTDGARSVVPDPSESMFGTPDISRPTSGGNGGCSVRPSVWDGSIAAAADATIEPSSSKTKTEKSSTNGLDDATRQSSRGGCSEFVAPNPVKLASAPAPAVASAKNRLDDSTRRPSRSGGSNSVAPCLAKVAFGGESVSGISSNGSKIVDPGSKGCVLDGSVGSSPPLSCGTKQLNHSNDPTLATSVNSNNGSNDGLGKSEVPPMSEPLTSAATSSAAAKPSSSAEEGSSSVLETKTANETSKATAKMKMTIFEQLMKEIVRPLLANRVRELTSFPTSSLGGNRSNEDYTAHIVVVGNRGHGKTSVLEALCGVDLLPRGGGEGKDQDQDQYQSQEVGARTRVPIVLQLRAAVFGDEHATIRLLRLPSSPSASEPERIALKDIGDAVRRYMSLAVGDGRDGDGGTDVVKDEPIELRIYRNDRDALTLVDLPGLVSVADGDNRANPSDEGGGGDGDGGNDISSHSFGSKAVIQRMCEAYMKPEQSIILNVVSATADDLAATANESLRLSRELDPSGRRSILCVTKIDRSIKTNAGGALDGNIRAAMESLKLGPDRVFAVRNRTQYENSISLPLEDVRLFEEMDLEALTSQQRVGGGKRERVDSGLLKYGMGVEALSKQLVRLQSEQILQSLPRSRAAINRQVEELKATLDKLGRPVGSSGSDSAPAASCRARVVNCIERLRDDLRNEIAGLASGNNDRSELTRFCEGACLELALTVDDFAALRRISNESSQTLKESITVGGFKFELRILPQYKDLDYKTRRAANVAVNVGASLFIEAPAGVKVKSMVVTFSLAADSQDKSFSHDFGSFDFAESIAKNKDIGRISFIKKKDAEDIVGPVVFLANIVVEKLVLEKSGAPAATDTVDDGVLLCAKLNRLQDEFVDSMDRLYSDRYFFSIPFRKKLEYDISASRGRVGGGAGLLETSVSHVSKNLLRALMEKIPRVVEVYRDGIWRACHEKVRSLVSKHVEPRLHPKLHDLVIRECKRLFEKHLSRLEGHHDLILGWEGSMCGDSRSVADAVRDVRVILADNKGNDRPPHLRHLSDSIIKKMSSVDQKIVDMQIEIFAHWKTMKKRLVDYVIMSTRSELVNKLIDRISLFLRRSCVAGTRSW